MKTLVLIGGPTACGKTALTIELAKTLRSEIINADSRQFYKEMHIGTAVPSAEELAAIPHHFIQSHSIHEPLSAADYETQAMELLETLFQKHEVVFVCGGSGLYLQALSEGLDPLPPSDPAYREELETLLKEKGAGALAELMRKKDPKKAAAMDLKNPRRVIRALEILQSGPLPESKKKERPFQVVSLCLNREREELYKRIDDRVLKMMEAGLLEEVRTLLPFRELSALQTVGYRELFDHLEGKMDLDAVVQQIQQHTRNYAKRQLTWFRNKGNYQEVFSFKEALAIITRHLDQGQ